MPSCILRDLPADLTIPGAHKARSVNPQNAPARGLVLPAQHIALLTSRYWGAKSRKLTVGFLDRVSVTQRTTILRHMNAWYTAGAGISFVYTAATAQVRITFAPDGYWSYLGTDITLIPDNEPTMCLEDFGTSQSDAEMRRVVRHETGHTLGFPHEHMRRQVVNLIDPAKAYAYFRRTQGWDRQTVQEQVLTPLEDADLQSTSFADANSIMCYQLPGSIMKTGKPVTGGVDIDRADLDFARLVYPR